MSINLMFTLFGISAMFSVFIASWAEDEGRFSYKGAFVIGLIFSPLVSLLVVAMQPRRISPEPPPMPRLNADGRGLFVDADLNKLCSAARVPNIEDYDNFTDYHKDCISVADFCNGQSLMLAVNKMDHCIIIPTSATETITAKPGDWIVVYGDGMEKDVFSTRIFRKRLKPFTPSPLDNISTGMF